MSKRVIDEGLFVAVHGVQQWVTLRGESRDNPVLLMIPGPGAGFSTMAPYFASWERDYTLAQWDQPRAGFTLAKNGTADTEPYTFERLARDGIAVSEFICGVLGVSKLIVLGISAGTITALNLVQRRPDLFSAYVGNGQVVDWARQDAESYRLLVERARAAKDTASLAELEAIGPPPYKDTATDAIKSKHAGAFTAEEQRAMGALFPAVIGNIMNPPPDAHYLAKGLALSDVRAAATAAYDALRDPLITFDARKLGLDFEVPMFFLQGAQDMMTVSSEVHTYVSELRAPHKELVLIEGGGHSSVFMRDAFLDTLNAHVRPALSGRTTSRRS
jgi:pimeloyl-ACP methyl ester carboxylesterase